MPLTAAELMRVLINMPAAQSDPFQQIGNLFILFSEETHAALFQLDGKDLAHRFAWIQGGIGILENGLDNPAIVQALGCLHMLGRIRTRQSD